MLKKLKEFLRNWLFKEELKSLDYISKNCAFKYELKHNEDLIKSFLATCQTGYDLGVSKYHKNWCVFVRQGKTKDKPDFVKFMDLSHLTNKDLKCFEEQLRHLDRRRDINYRQMDVPMGMKDYFNY